MESPIESFARYARQLLTILEHVVRGNLDRFAEVHAQYTAKITEYAQLPEGETRTRREERVLALLDRLEERQAAFAEMQRILVDRKRKLSLSTNSLVGMVVGEDAAISQYDRAVLPANLEDDAAVQASMATSILDLIVDVDTVQAEGKDMIDQVMGGVQMLLPPSMKGVLQGMRSGGYIQTKTGEPTYPIARFFIRLVVEDMEDRALADRIEHEMFDAYVHLPTTLAGVMEAYRARHPEAEVEPFDFMYTPCQETIIGTMAMMTSMTMTWRWTRESPSNARQERIIRRTIMGVMAGEEDEELEEELEGELEEGLAAQE